MKINKSEIGIVTALLTFIAVKAIFSEIGIESIPAPIVITLLVVSYVMFVLGASKNLIRKEKVYFILCASLLAIFLLACIVIVILMHYFQQIIIEHHGILLLLLVVAMISLACSGLLANTIKRMRA